MITYIQNPQFEESANIYDKMSVQDFVQNTNSSDLVQKLFFIALETVFTISNFQEFNFLYFLRILKASGGYRPLMLTKGKKNRRRQFKGV